MAVKKILLAASIAGNVLLLLFVVFALFSRNSRSLAFLDMDGGNTEYASGACVVSVPREGAGITFGPAEFSLAAGSRAALQFSAFQAGSQINLYFEPLYDREIISVEQSGYGVIVTALKAGETLLQTITAEGIRDIARVTVTEKTGF
jgi:hypothetical protein